ncbi:MAG: helix-turn-helix transcriptional regulator [Hyphomicrobium sp.]
MRRKSKDDGPGQNQQPRLTMREARRMAAEWEADLEDHIRETDLEDRFAGMPPMKLLDMMEKGRNEKGRKLNKLEFEALARALYQLFGTVPYVVQGDKPQDSEPLPQDDTMLDIKEVSRLSGLSVSTIKRNRDVVGFPQPIRISERRIAWKAGEVRKYIEGLERLGRR